MAEDNVKSNWVKMTCCHLQLKEKKKINLVISIL